MSQQQIHAQQLPHGAVVGGLPPGGLLGFAGAAAAAAAAGVPPHLAPPPHPAAAAAVQAQAQALLKPADLQQHRATAETPEDRKPIALPDERLGHRSVSPPEKFRSRTPDLESDPKRRKEEKLGHVSTLSLPITGTWNYIPPFRIRARAFALESIGNSIGLEMYKYRYLLDRISRMTLSLFAVIRVIDTIKFGIAGILFIILCVKYFSNEIRSNCANVVYKILNILFYLQFCHLLYMV